MTLNTLSQRFKNLLQLLPIAFLVWMAARLGGEVGAHFLDLSRPWKQDERMAGDSPSSIPFQRIGQSIEQAKAAGKKTVFYIGDSTVIGQGLLDDETLPHWVQENLGPQYSITNGSTAGSSSLDKLAAAVRLGKNLPDLVITNLNISVLGIYASPKPHAEAVLKSHGILPIQNLRDGLKTGERLTEIFAHDWTWALRNRTRLCQDYLSGAPCSSKAYDILRDYLHTGEIHLAPPLRLVSWLKSNENERTSHMLRFASVTSVINEQAIRTNLMGYGKLCTWLRKKNVKLWVYTTPLNPEVGPCSGKTWVSSQFYKKAIEPIQAELEAQGCLFTDFNRCQNLALTRTGEFRDMDHLIGAGNQSLSKPHAEMIRTTLKAVP